MPGPDGLFAHYLGGACRCGTDHREGSAARPAPAQVAQPAQDSTRYVAALWRESRPAAGSTVEAYLAGRGLAGPLPPSLRYHPALRHYPSGRTLPAMVAAVARLPEGRVVAIHRTWLARDGSGKADVSPSRMMLGPVAGGAVWLAPPAERMALAEGIESGLAAQRATGVPTWAALSASNMPRVALPALPLASELVIAADNDSAGLRAAHRAAERFTAEGRRVRIAVPPSGDFNDALVRGAA